jgi:hypothetical protein
MYAVETYIISSRAKSAAVYGEDRVAVISNVMRFINSVYEALLHIVQMFCVSLCRTRFVSANLDSKRDFQPTDNDAFTTKKSCPHKSHSDYDRMRLHARASTSESSAYIRQ